MSKKPNNYNHSYNKNQHYENTNRKWQNQNDTGKKYSRDIPHTPARRTDTREITGYFDKTLTHPDKHRSTYNSGYHNNVNQHHDIYSEEERRYKETRLIREGIDELTVLLSEVLKNQKQTPAPQDPTEGYSPAEKDRVAIFVDGSNVRYAISSITAQSNPNKTDTLQFDVRRLCNYIETNIGQITDAYYYDSAERAEGTSLNFTQNNGFAQIFKPVKVIQTGVNGKTSKKCNLDVEIVLDMMATINHYDVCVLLSGDSDFKRPLEVLKSMGKKFVVISTRNSISRELLHLAGRHLLLIDEHPDWFA